jgi:hypothetical protein
MTQRKLGIITAGTASGPNGLLRKNYRHLTHLDEADLSRYAVNGGFKFLKGERHENGSHLPGGAGSESNWRCNK